MLKLRRTLLITTLLLAMCLGLAVPAWAADMTIILDGKELVSDVAPEVKNGVTFVPIRVVAENLGADVSYYPAADGIRLRNYLREPNDRTIKTETAQVTISESGMKFYAGKPVVEITHTAVAGGNISTQELHELMDESYPLLAAPYIKNNRMMVPLRFIAERIGFKVEYSDNRIIITTAKRLALDGVDIKDMLLEDDYVSKNKQVIFDAITLLQESRGEQCPAASDYAYVTPKLSFRNADGEVVAIWQFAAPKGESWQEQPFSILYLHDRLNDVWYTADQTVYDKLYNANLENYLLPPYYAFERLN